jgi:hypothetical protein
MSRHGGPLAIVWLCAAAVVPGLALGLNGGRPAGLAVSPFASEQLVVIHVLAAIPLAALLAAFAMRVARMAVNSWLTATMGIGAAVLVVAAGPAVGDWLDAANAGFSGRFFCRIGLCTTLALPWSVGAVAAAWPGETPTVGRSIAAASLLLGILAPVVAASRIADDLSTRANEQLERDRLAAAADTLTGIAQIEPHRLFTWHNEKWTAASLLVQLRQTIARLNYAVVMGSAKGRAAQFDRGWALVMLGRPAEAAQELEPLALELPTARLLLGEVYCELGRTRSGEEAIQSGLNELLPSAAHDPRAAEMCQLAFDTLARIARERNDPSASEALYSRAIQALPDRAAYFHLQLGRQYQHTGRPREALAQFEQATRLNPDLQPRIEPQVRILREQTPGCLLGRTSGAVSPPPP